MDLKEISTHEDILRDLLDALNATSRIAASLGHAELMERTDRCIKMIQWVLMALAN